MIKEKIKVNNFLCRVIKHEEGGGTPVIFLHGYIFTSEVWREINVLKALEENKIPFIAIDMPYGVKSDSQPKSSDIESNVKIVEEIVGNREVLIVGASLGGYVALKFSVKHPVKGLFLIAPVRGLEEALVREYSKIKGKVWIIYGENDKIVTKEEMEKLAEVLEAKLIIYENAEHPAYLAHPLRFKEDLLKFYQIIK